MKTAAYIKQHKIEKEDIDEERMREVLDILYSLFFLREEAKRKKHTVIYALITSIFNICIIVYDQVCDRGDTEILDGYDVSIKSTKEE